MGPQNFEVAIVAIESLTLFGIYLCEAFDVGQQVMHTAVGHRAQMKEACTGTWAPSAQVWGNAGSAQSAQMANH